MNEEVEFLGDFSSTTNFELLEKSTIDKLEEIKNGQKKDINFTDCISLADLMITDSLGITYLEYACKNGVDFSYSICKEICNNKEALLMCAQLKNISWFTYTTINEDILFLDVQDDKKVIDFIMPNISSFLFISDIKNHPEIIDYLVKYNVSIYSLSDEVINSLFNNASFLVDKYANNKNFIFNVIPSVPIKLLYEYCQISGDKSLLKYVKEDAMLYETDNGKIILEELLDSNIDPLFYGYYFKNEKILDILVKKNRFDLLYNAELSLLLSSSVSGKTFFEMMINAYKNGVDVHFEEMSFAYWNNSSEQTAKLLMMMAQNGIIGYVPNISKKMLLYKGKQDDKSVLEYLIEFDKNITMNVIISDKLLRDKDFVFTLKTLDVEKGFLNINSLDEQFSDKFILKYNQDYMGKYENENYYLLTELYNSFISDGITDKITVEALVSSYAYYISTGNPYAILELQQLIAIKKTHPEFVYEQIGRTSNICSHFNSGKGSISLEDYIIGTINHETSHALHYYLADMAIPDNYYYVIEKVRDNPQTITRVKEYSEMFVKLKEELKSSISQDEINEYYDSKYTGNNLFDLANFLSQTKDEQREKYKDELPDEVLDTILAKSYSVSEFIESRKQLEVSKILDIKLRNDYDAFIAIGDIIDAIYLGKYRNGVLLDNDKRLIPHTFGHGIAYYSNSIHGFDEMIANYGSILKSKKSKEILNMLKYIVGDELVEMLDNFYKNRMLKSNVIKKIFEEEEYGYGR